MGRRPGVAGATILAPWHSRVELEDIPEGQQPQFERELLATGELAA